RLRRGVNPAAVSTSAGSHVSSEAGSRRPAIGGVCRLAVARSTAPTRTSHAPCADPVLGTYFREVLTRVPDSPCDGTGGNGRGARDERLGFLVTHTPREVPVGRADALHGLVHAAECIHRPSKARGAARILRHLNPGGNQDLPHGAAIPSGGLQLM